MRSSLFIAAAATLSTASASIQGFNYGSAKTDGSFMFEADFKSKFNTAKNLVGASGFSSARLYTMIVS
jgi:glucan endo-1,3-beta-D-glucosidase